MLVLTLEILDLFAVSFPFGVAGQALFACLQELFAPAVVQIAVDPFPAAELGDRRLTAQPFHIVPMSLREDDTDLVFSRIFLAGFSTDVLDGFFDRFFFGHDVLLDC